MTHAQNLIINLDELLLDLPSLKQKIWQDLADIHNFEITETFLLASFDANSDKVEKLQREYPKHAPYFDTVQKRYEGMIDAKLNTLKPSALRLIELQRLAQEYAISLCSNLSRRQLEGLSCLKELGFTPIYVFSTKEVMLSKPDPAIYLKIARLLKELPNKLIVVDATLNGIQASYLANTKGIFVAEHFEPSSTVKEYSTAYTEHFNQVKTILDEWLKDRNE